MNKLEELEQRYKFSYPELYKKLFEDGMLDWGETVPNWHAVYWEKFKNNPPLLLFGNDIELIDYNRIIEETDAYRNPEDYRATKPEFIFIPFARTGGGDLYVFQFDKQYDDNIPITLVPHDWNEATILAKNLSDFIFRKLIECVVELDKYSKVKDGNLKTNLSNMLRTHKPYLNLCQIAKIEEIYNRELFEYKYQIPSGREFSATGLISRNEFEMILQQEIGFEDFNKEFIYMD